LTFIEYLKIKKGIDVRGEPMTELMESYYAEYAEYLAGLKDGCGAGEDEE
jgi:hypothetical protein